MPIRRTRTLKITLALLPLVAVPAIAVEPQEVSFLTWDDVTVCGDYYKPKTQDAGAPMVLLLHMYGSDRTSWAPLIEPLHEAGFGVLAIDLRGHGGCARPQDRKRVEQRDTTVFEEMDQDVLAAYDFLASREGLDRSRFAIVGASVGCSVALRYAEKDKSVDAVVCLSPGANYLGMNSTTDIRNIKGRRIWMVASKDKKERQGVDVLGPLASGAEVELLPEGADHGTRMFTHDPLLPHKIVEFLQKSVGPPSKSVVYGSVRSDIYHFEGSGWIEQIKPWNMRHYSSPKEAESRGLRKAKSRGPKGGP